MGLQLEDYDKAVWLFTGKSVKRPTLVPRQNCRPAKEVYDQEVVLITSECVSLDTCAPKVRAYHKFAATLSVKETIPGIGLGCDIITGGMSYTRRSLDSDAGNSLTYTQIRIAMAFITNDLALGALIDPKFFPANSSATRVCPGVA